jgi:hypothetical protein
MLNLVFLPGAASTRTLTRGEIHQSWHEFLTVYFTCVNIHLFSDCHDFYANGEILKICGHENHASQRSKNISGKCWHNFNVKRTWYDVWHGVASGLRATNLPSHDNQTF